MRAYGLEIGRCEESGGCPTTQSMTSDCLILVPVVIPRVHAQFSRIQMTAQYPKVRAPLFQVVCLQVCVEFHSL